MDAFFTAHFSANTPGPQPRAVARRAVTHPLARALYDTFGLQRSSCGFYELVDPSATLKWYAPWLRATEEAYELAPLQPLMRTAFGDLFAVPEDGSDLLALICIDTSDPEPLAATFATVAPADALLRLTVHDEIYTAYNLHRHAFLPEHARQLREGPSGATLGFYPPLVLGGEDDPLSVEIVPLRRHLELLAMATGL